MTARFAIVLDLPVDFSVALMGKGFPFAWNPDRAGRVGLLPRDGNLAALRWIEAPSCYVFHVMNAYDDPTTNDVVIDVVRHPKVFASEMRGPSEGEPILVRWRIDLKSGRLAETVLDDRGLEFPRFNDAHGGLPYRYGYTAGAFEALKAFGPAYKHDVVAGRNETHDYGPGRATLEPVFVARDGARAEDDGYILSYVYDAARDASDVVILDAQDFAGAPLATIALPARVPFGFHGNWIADRA
jgi:carotenoid cleavage dioxygenase